MDLIKMAKAISAVAEVYEDARRSKSLQELQPITTFIASMDAMTDNFVEEFIQPISKALQNGVKPKFEEKSSDDKSTSPIDVDFLLKSIDSNGSC